MGGYNIIINGMDGQHTIGPVCLTRNSQSDLYEKMLSNLNHAIAMAIWRSTGPNSNLYFNPEGLADN